MELYQNLKNSTKDTLKLFSLEGVLTFAKLVDIYDGDTCTLNIIYNNDLIQMKCRMLGYDSPEMKPPKNLNNREEIKQKAIISRDKLQSYLADKVILIKCDTFDKYGRLLVTVYNSNQEVSEIKEFTFNESINKVMIEGGYGYAYDGGKKMGL